MGFKDMLARNTSAKVREILDAFRPTVGRFQGIEENIVEIEERESHGEIIRPKSSALKQLYTIRMVRFSDSIILISRDDSFLAAKRIIFYIRKIINDAMMAETPVPIKGAIAYGENTDDFENDLHFGTPLIDAQQLQNELFLYGAVLHHTVERHFFNNDMLRNLGGNSPVSMSTPMKSGKITHYLVNWPSLTDDKSKLSSAMLKMYGNVSGHARQYVDNTKEFIDIVNAREVKS
jgi:hypothetical protein